MRRPIRDIPLASPLLLALLLAGCAPHAGPVADTSHQVPLGGVEYGVIASLRPVAVPVDPAERRILAAIGMGPALNRDRAANQAPPPSEMEFIIRADDGRTLSVMQPNDQDFHAGERVALSPGPRTRVARPVLLSGS